MLGNYGWHCCESLTLLQNRHNVAMKAQIPRDDDVLWTAFAARPFILSSFLSVVCFLVFFLVPSSAFAWNSTGHRLSAALAWEILTPRVRDEVTRLLDAHPAANTWEQMLRGQRGMARFSEAATWPDTLRDTSPADDASVGPSRDSSNDGRDWHYLNWPIGLPRGASRGGKLLLQLDRLATLIGDPELSMSERSIALAWLAHLVGDAHTPLHAANWRDSEGRWTAGGNSVPVTDPERARNGHGADTNLHRFWDDLPGPSGLRGRRLNERATALERRFPASAITQGAPFQWIEESHQAVIDVVRRDGRDPTRIDPEYRLAAETLAARRVAESGVRLGRWLNLLLARSAAANQGTVSGER